MDTEGQICNKENSFGCMVQYRLLQPDRCFVGDEVGGNISMKGDGHVVGKLFLTSPDAVAYDQVSISEKRFTLIGLVALDSSPVMCVLIIQGKTKDLPVETGIKMKVTPE